MKENETRMEVLEDYRFWSQLSPLYVKDSLSMLLDCIDWKV
jgi:hypothetical protein